MSSVKLKAVVRHLVLFKSCFGVIQKKLLRFKFLGLVSIHFGSEGDINLDWRQLWEVNNKRLA